MKNDVWIWNHYATNMFFEQAGRHYWFAKNLNKRGYNSTVFCASTVHNSAINIDTGEQNYISDTVNGVPFIFIKTPGYTGNGMKRIINMIAFYIRLFSAARKYAQQNGKPDIILASSVHPLTLVAGIKIAKKLKVPCLCEVRDLWPESLVAYGSLKKNSILAKILYTGEKWIYKKSDAIIMTWEGGRQYIIDRGWDKQIMEDVKYISNGVSIDDFDRNSIENQVHDKDIEDKQYRNIVYAGSIRKVNNLAMLLDASKIIKRQGFKNIRFLIYGDGSECDALKKRCAEEEIDNVIFKGRVKKKYIPSILKQADINILHNTSTSLDRYGQSQNKFFEYLAAGRCIIQTYTTGYSIINKENCGICVSEQSSEGIANAIISACRDNEKCEMMGKNARRVAYKYDYNILTQKLIDVIESLV